MIFFRGNISRWSPRSNCGNFKQHGLQSTLWSYHHWEHDVYKWSKCKRILLWWLRRASYCKKRRGFLCSGIYCFLISLLLFNQQIILPPWYFSAIIIQVGIVSFGGGICEEGYPSGQVLVHKFSDWIESVTGLTF